MSTGHACLGAWRHATEMRTLPACLSACRMGVAARPRLLTAAVPKNSQHQPRQQQQQQLWRSSTLSVLLLVYWTLLLLSVCLSVSLSLRLSLCLVLSCLVSLAATPTLALRPLCIWHALHPMLLLQILTLIYSAVARDIRMPHPFALSLSLSLWMCRSFIFGALIHIYMYILYRVCLLMCIFPFNVFVKTHQNCL